MLGLPADAFRWCTEHGLVIDPQKPLKAYEMVAVFEVACGLPMLLLACVGGALAERTSGRSVLGVHLIPVLPQRLFYETDLPVGRTGIGGVEKRFVGQPSGGPRGTDHEDVPDAVRDQGSCRAVGLCALLSWAMRFSRDSRPSYLYADWLSHGDGSRRLQAAEELGAWGPTRLLLSPPSPGRC